LLRNGILGVVVVVLDVLAIVAGLWTAHAAWVGWRPHMEQQLHVRWWELWLPNPFMPSALVLLFAWLLVLRRAGLYDPGRITNSARIAAGVSRASAVLVVVVMVLQFLLPDRTYSRFLILAFCGASSLYIGLFRIAFFLLQKRIPQRIPRVNVAIVGVGEEARQMAGRLERYSSHAYRMVGYIGTAEDPERMVEPHEVLGTIPELVELVNRHDLGCLILATRSMRRTEAMQLATRADQMGLRVHQVPFTWGVASPRVDLARVGNLQLIDLTALGYPTLGEQIKRAVDLVLIGLAVPLLAPVVAVVALLVRLQDGGPAFFSQPRAGRGGRQFPFFKFRSMVVDAEARRAALQAHNEAGGVLFKMSDDPRITPLGRFLRKYSIDELPQLWNVVRGDMNLVGPRPLPMSDLVGVETDPEIQYWFELRHKVRPGITGPWQVSGRSDSNFQAMVQHDIDYIQSWSFWGDLLILVKTIPAVLRGRGAR
jgi:exopolysaccharide biosynthesis polyprenyl glycosylphosphotransferase